MQLENILYNRISRVTQQRKTPDIAPLFINPIRMAMRTDKFYMMQKRANTFRLASKFNCSLLSLSGSHRMTHFTKRVQSYLSKKSAVLIQFKLFNKKLEQLTYLCYN